MNFETFEHGEIQAIHAMPSKTDPAVEWLESRPLIAPPKMGHRAASTVSRRPMFELLRDHNGLMDDALATCNICEYTLFRGGQIIDLEADDE